mmetsp:Transcript_159883/g.291874  ORF Transcript_159883/g.291874 Transcript_159883/m.291874 type:complete len:120 (-) Transcript_159883:1242-1601(-)
MRLHATLHASAREIASECIQADAPSCESIHALHVIPSRAQYPVMHFSARVHLAPVKERERASLPRCHRRWLWQAKPQYDCPSSLVQAVVQVVPTVGSARCPLEVGVEVLSESMGGARRQ